MEYIQIGKLVATHGVKGEIILQHVLGEKIKPAALKQLKALFIEEVKDSYIPYFLEQATPRSGTELLVKLEGLDSKEGAKHLIRKNAWVVQADFGRLADASTPIALIGYMVVNEDEPLSTVLEVIEQPHQILLRIEYQQKEVLIPLHAETLDKIDRVKKEVHVTLPDGLLEIYLEG